MTRPRRPDDEATSHPPGMRRRGYALLETVVAAVLLMAAMTLTVRLLGWVAAERRAAERRQWATQEAANVMERLSARSWDALTPEAVRPAELSPAARAVLPRGALRVEVSERDGLKRIAVEVHWAGRAGVAEAPVRLVSWVARPGRAS